jgi:hypothetical protein
MATPLKSLKEQNRWQIWFIILINSAFLYGVVEANAIELDGIRSIFTDTSKLVPFGLAVVVATVLNGLVPANVKARLVFLRWRDALPGHRAFTRYINSDPRIDPAAVGKVVGGALPVDPVEQNRVWFRLYKTVENDPAILQVHRDFLLTRDYTGLAVLFLLLYGGAGFYSIPSSKIAAIYIVLLLIQCVVVRQAAYHYGIRFVTSVLARVASKPTGGGASTSSKRRRSA